MPFRKVCEEEINKMLEEHKQQLEDCLKEQKYGIDFKRTTIPKFHKTIIQFIETELKPRLGLK